MSENSQPTRGTPTLLIIDDDETHRLLARDCLEREGYQILEAASGDAGLAVMRERRVDLVLLDLVMPGRDGYSICEEIRMDARLRDTPVLMVTGSEDLDAVDRTFAARADDFITKPVRWTLLPYRVRFTLRNREDANTLRQALIQSQAADEAKSQFLAAIGHELRTPLNAIIGFSEIIANPSLAASGSGKHGEYAGDILSCGRHLLVMINGILDMVKLQEGTLVLQLQPLDLKSFLEDCRQTFHSECEIAGHEFAMRIEDDLPALNADPHRMRQIMRCLVSNAAKFTPAGGRVEISACRSVNNGVDIVVADNGVGMSTDEAKIALQPFRQVDGRLSRAHEGAGLGLPIAKALAELHSGSLAVESAPGDGTKIIVNLPATLSTAGLSPLELRRAG